MDEEEINVHSNIRCKLCGENKFNLKDGFYYCTECGTKQDQVRAIEVEHDPDFLTNSHVKKIKIQSLKVEKPQLTSWECYNYILRGLVEKLIGFGAKEELKLMSLQIWAAYLRTKEVAFFGKTHTELPKLGIKFLKRDVVTLYNHVQEKRNKRKRNVSVSSLSNKSGDLSAREYRKKKRKLDETVYSQNSTNPSSASFWGSQSFTSTSTGTTGRAIQLKFNAMARRRLKKVMPSKHIKKHEMDSEGRLDCHNLRGTLKKVQRGQLELDTISMKLMYTILGIALNFIQDDIQISDLVRYIAEGHIGTKNVLQYFPQNLSKNSNELLKEIDYHINHDQTSNKALRDHIESIAAFTHLSEFKKVDILKLCQRYIIELNLPTEIESYVTRLFNILPPEMAIRGKHIYPDYEARAMAYIVFVLKLIFGLDGHKERQISDAAAEINKLIEKITKDKENSEQSFLFVWNEWVEYIEMRKIIVSQYNSAFCKQFNQGQSFEQLIDELKTSNSQQNEQAMLNSDDITNGTVKVICMQEMFKNLLQIDEIKTNSLSFPPTLTPAHSYFNAIRLHNKNLDQSRATLIPTYMQIVHPKRILQPFLKPRKLVEFFQKYNYKMNVVSLPCTTNRIYAGVFKMGVSLHTSELRTFKADFEVNDEEWLKTVHTDLIANELEFKKKLDRYEKQYSKVLEARNNKRKEIEFIPPVLINKYNNSKNIENSDKMSTISLNAFSELNMDPLVGCNLNVPRRNLDTRHLIDYINADNDADYDADDDDDDDDHDDNDQSSREQNDNKKEQNNGNNDNTIKLIKSNFDCWTLMGSVFRLMDVHKKILETKLPRSFLWLLTICAQTIGVDWTVVYENVLVLELMYGYGIEDLEQFKTCLRYKYNNPIKDVNILINTYREIW